MLELIVLGQVPGTSLQLNLTAIIFIAISLYILSQTVSTFYHYHRFMAQFGLTAGYFALTDKRTAKKRA